MPKQPVLRTWDAKEDLDRIWKENRQLHDELLLIRGSLDQRLEQDPEAFAVEIRPDGTAVGFEPKLPLGKKDNVALGVEYIVDPPKVFRAWLWKKPKRKRE